MQQTINKPGGSGITLAMMTEDNNSPKKYRERSLMEPRLFFRPKDAERVTRGSEARPPSKRWRQLGSLALAEAVVIWDKTKPYLEDAVASVKRQFIKRVKVEPTPMRPDNETALPSSGEPHLRLLEPDEPNPPIYNWAGDIYKSNDPDDY